MDSVKKDWVIGILVALVGGACLMGLQQVKDFGHEITVQLANINQSLKEIAIHDVRVDERINDHEKRINRLEGGK